MLCAGNLGCGEQSRSRIRKEGMTGWLMGPEFGKEVGEYEGMRVPGQERQQELPLCAGR